MKIKVCWVKTWVKGNGLKNPSQIHRLRGGQGFRGYSEMTIMKLGSKDVEKQDLLLVSPSLIP